MQDPDLVVETMSFGSSSQPARPASSSARTQPTNDQTRSRSTGRDSFSRTLRSIKSISLLVFIGSKLICRVNCQNFWNISGCRPSNFFTLGQKYYSIFRQCVGIFFTFQASANLSSYFSLNQNLRTTRKLSRISIVSVLLFIMLHFCLFWFCQVAYLFALKEAY